MNFAHIHIVLNHVPTIGTVVALGLFIYASYIRKSEELKQASLLAFVVMAILVLPTYLTGNAAQLLLRNREDIAPGWIEAHQNWAILTFLLMTFTGAVSWFGLWQIRRYARAGSGTLTAVLVLALLTTALILRTSNLGGHISHPEVRYEEPAPGDDVGWRASIETFVWGYAWVWPATETLHFIGLAPLFAVALVLNLRMLGMMKGIPFQALHRLLPLGIMAFVVNVLTGMLFFIASPGQYSGSNAFALKIFMIVLVSFSVLYFTVFEGPWKVGRGEDAPLTSKVMAVGVMILVLLATYYGRMLPFLE